MITRTRVTNAEEPGDGSIGAFDALLDLLAVHTLLAGASLLIVTLTSRDSKTFTWTEAVATLRLMIGGNGRDPAQYALHSGRIGGAAQ